MINSNDCWLKENCKRLHCNDENGCLILYKLDYLYDQAGIPLKLRKKLALHPDGDGTDLKEFEILKRIQDNIVEFIEAGHNLNIHSVQPGNGKTSWAIKLVQTYFNKIWLKTEMKCRALFINVPYLLLALKENISNKSSYIQHIKDNIYNCDLVIWDDIGTKSITTYESENLFSMIDARLNQGKSNIFTSNLTNDELHQVLGDRLSSRICNLSFDIELRGGDKRYAN